MHSIHKFSTFHVVNISVIQIKMEEGVNFFIFTIGIDNIKKHRKGF